MIEVNRWASQQMRAKKKKKRLDSSLFSQTESKITWIRQNEKRPGLLYHKTTKRNQNIFREVVGLMLPSSNNDIYNEASCTNF